MSASSSTPGISTYRTRAGELRWRVRWREGGQHCSRSFTSEKQAEAFRAEVVLARTQGRPLNLPRSMVTLAQFAHDQWWPGHAMLELEPSTRQRHKEVWNKWVLPYLGQEPLTAIDVEDLLEWQVKVKQDGIGHATLQRARAVLSSVFSFAALRPRKSGVKLNPVAALPPLKRQRERPVQVYPPLVFETLRAVLREHGGENGKRDALMVGIAYLAGCRPGEALRRRAGDVRERTLQVTSARGADSDGDPAEKGTKTGRLRQVPMLAPLRDDLLEWIEEQELGDDDLLLTDANGRPWTEASYKAWRRRVFRPATERVAEILGIPDFAGERPYCARHSFASLMIRAGHGNNLKGLAEILGHDLSVLLSCYAGELAEFSGADPIDAEAEIYAAREAAARLVR